MTQKLILLLSSELSHRGFICLAQEFGNQRTHELNRLLSERLLAEVFPLEEPYEIMLASDQTIQDLSKWLGSNLEGIGAHISYGLLETEEGRSSHPLHQVLNKAFSDPEVEKVICMKVGAVQLNEERIISLFSEIDNDQLLCGMGTDDSIVTLGLQRSHLPVFESLDFGDEQVLELLQLRAEHYKRKCHLSPVCLIPGDLNELALFRDQLPAEHFVAMKIDDMVLEKLRPTGDAGFDVEHARSIQFEIDPDTEIDSELE